MENKQLESEDLLMNKKEELIWRVIDNVISCCAITRIDGAKSITRMVCIIMVILMVFGCNL